MSRKIGKVIDTITYRGEGSSELSVPLRLTTLNGVYTYIVQSDDPKIYVRGEDANKVKAEVLEKLKAAHSIKWQDVILIQVDRQCNELGYYSHSRYNNGDVTLNMGLGCELNVRLVSLGRATGGDPVWRDSPVPAEDLHFNSRASKDIHPTTPEGVNYDYAAGTFSADTDEGYAILPDTEANRHKLRQLLRSFDILSKQIALLLGQERITQTLTNMKVLGLPPPDAAPGCPYPIKHGKAPTSPQEGDVFVIPPRTAPPCAPSAPV